MSDLQAQFEQAAQDIQPARPDNTTKLKLYALYKQATVGDVNTDPPGAFDFVARAKHDAWSAVRGTTREAAMQQYIDMVASIVQR